MRMTVAKFLSRLHTPTPRTTTRRRPTARALRAGPTRWRREMPASNRRPLWDSEDGIPPPPHPTSHHAAEASGSVSGAVASPGAAHVRSTRDGFASAPALHAPGDASSSPAAAAAAAAATAASPAFKQPCTFKGAASALYAGLLGYFLGAVPAAIKFKGRQWGMVHGQGLGSARQLAVMSGLYTAVHCICQRIRLVEDGWNRGIAGCSTGLVLGWSNGPWSAAQSCAGLGAISALVDLGGGAVEAAEAAVLHSLLDLQQAAVAAKQARAMEVSGGEGQRPLPAHLAMLLLGLPPATIGGLLPAAAASSSSSSGADDATLNGVSAPVAARNQPVQQQQQCLAVPATGRGPLHPAYQQRQQLQQQQQQGQQLLRPAMHAVQQLLAPPLMYLGACCQGETRSGSSSSSSRGNQGNALALRAGVAVEGCAVVGGGGAGGAVPPQKCTSARR